MNRPTIDPALGLDLVAHRTLDRQHASISVIIPAHNEAETIEHVVSEAQRGIELLGVPGDVLVSASGCTDDTAELAVKAGANVVQAPVGKGEAIIAGLAATTGEIVCLIDGDLQYFGEPPLVPLLVEPILHGIADATISDLYWRPLYPQLWLTGFFAPLAGSLFPELLPKVGSTPWSGQRAAQRHLWPANLPSGFTVDLKLLLHWNQHALRLRPVLADDWVNPQRPKEDLMAQELALLIGHAEQQGRLDSSQVPPVKTWFDEAHRLMATYQPDHDNPQQFEQHLLRESLRALHQQLHEPTTT